MSVDLSVDAPAFIPGGGSNVSGNPSGVNGNNDAAGQQLPEYMLNCYPFVKAPSERLSTSGWDAKQALATHDAVGLKVTSSWQHGNTVAPATGLQLAFQYGLQPSRLQPPLVASTMAAPYGWMHPGGGHYPRIPVAYASESGTYSGYKGTRRQHDRPRGLPQPSRAGTTVQVHHQRPQNHHHEQMQESGEAQGRKGSKTVAMVSVGTQNDILRAGGAGTARGGSSKRERQHTLMVKDSSMQTDFSEDFSNLTLVEQPSTLYMGRDSRLTCGSVATTVAVRHPQSSSGLLVSGKSQRHAGCGGWTLASIEDSDSGYSSQLRRLMAAAAISADAVALLKPAGSVSTYASRVASSTPPCVTTSTTASSSASQTNRLPSRCYDSASAASPTAAITGSRSDGGGGGLSDGPAGGVCSTGRRRRRRHRKKNEAVSGTAGGASTGEDNDEELEGSSGGVSASREALATNLQIGAEFPQLIIDRPVMSGEFNTGRHTLTVNHASSYSDALKSYQSIQNKAAISNVWGLKSSREQVRSDGPDEGFMFSSVGFSHRDADSGEASVSCPHPSATSSSPALVATSRRQKKREDALLAAAEEQMEISLEQRVMRQLGPQLRLPPPALPPGGLGGSNRKSHQPLSISIADMISVAESKKKAAGELAMGKGASLRRPEDRLRGMHSAAGGHSGAVSYATNPLDSTAPKTKRGKERENPKAKRPSALKKVIMKEREEKKRSRDRVAGSAEDTGSNSGVIGASVEYGALSDDGAQSRPTANEEGLLLDGSFEGHSSAGGGLMSSHGCDVFTPASQASQTLSPVSQTSPISMSPMSPGSNPMTPDIGSPVAATSRGSQLLQEIQLKIHSRRFREYCDQLLDKDIDDCCTALLQELVRFQERLFQRDPVKAKSKRRLVLGLREVTKHLRLHKIKLVVVSPNLERIQAKGGLDEALSAVVTTCRQQAVPLVFALGRRALGRACAKLVPVSVVGVFMYDGAEAHFSRLMELTQKARDAYNEMVTLVALEAAEEESVRGVTALASSSAASGARHSDTAVLTPQPLLPSSPCSAHPFSPAGLSRSPSACSAVSQVSSINPSAREALEQARSLDAKSKNDREDGAAGDDEDDLSDGGNEADTEDNLRESAALSAYRRLNVESLCEDLLQGDAVLRVSATSDPPFASPCGGWTSSLQPAINCSLQNHEPLIEECSQKQVESAVPRRRRKQVDSDGVSASLRLAASGMCSGGSSHDSNVCGEDLAGVGGVQDRRHWPDDPTAAGSVQSTAGTAVAMLTLGSHERVENWVMQQTAVSAAAADALDHIIGDDSYALANNDAAEFVATFSACTANSDALMLPTAVPQRGSDGGAGSERSTSADSYCDDEFTATLTALSANSEALLT